MENNEQKQDENVVLEESKIYNSVDDFINDPEFNDKKIENIDKNKQDKFWNCCVFLFLMIIIFIGIFLATCWWMIFWTSGWFLNSYTWDEPALYISYALMILPIIGFYFLFK